jgi:hypothetical protein
MSDIAIPRPRPTTKTARRLATAIALLVLAFGLSWAAARARERCQGMEGDWGEWKIISRLTNRCPCSNKLDFSHPCNSQYLPMVGL